MPITLTLSNGQLVATTPAGHDLPIPPDMQGLVLLRKLCEWDQRRQHSAQPPSPQPIPVYFPSDYTRVCHCGREVTPFMERCDGCPGHAGAGKVPQVKRYTTSGKRQATLAELGWLGPTEE